MWIEDDELHVFCDLLSEVYVDNYINPSKEWTNLPAKDLEFDFERFKKKKHQSEKALEQDPDSAKYHQRLHYAFYPDDQKHPTPEEDAVFQAMADFLEPTGVIRNSVDLKKAYLALRWMLEDAGCYIPMSIQEKLWKVGVSIDSTQVTEWDKKHIAIQATGQVIAYDEGHFNIKKIKAAILDLDERMIKLLYLNQWKSVLKYDDNMEGFESKDRAKAIEKLIASVNPIPEGKRRGRPPRTPQVLREIIFIPGLFVDEIGITKINFRKLKIAIYYLAAILAIRGNPHDTIAEHPIILKYRNRLPVFFHSFSNVWINEALQKMADFFKSQPRRFS